MTLAVTFGVLAAWKVGTVIDRSLMVLSVIGFSVPVFVVGYMLIYVFSINLRWLPVQGYSPIAQGLWPWIERLILPSIALGLAYVALIARITRTSMLEVLAEDYIRTARAKGVATRSMLLKHALKNAGVPIVTVIGIGVALLIGGVVITETVFNIPGRRAPGGRRDLQARLSDHPGRDPDLLRRLRAGESPGRPELHRARSEDPLLSVITAEPPLVAANGRSRGAQLRRFARRNPTIVAGGAILGVITLLAIAAPLFAGDAITMQPALRLRPPSEANWLGTDHLGRDVFARTVYGAQVSLFVGISVAAVSISVGLVIGLLSGYFRKVDAVVMRLMDGLMAIPAILLAIALVALTRASVSTVIMAITIPEVPRVVRLVRAVVLSVREAPYVEAAVAGGTPTWKILLRHILPNTVAPLIVQATYICASAILIEAGALLPRRRHAAGDPDLGQHDRAEPAVPLAARPGPSSRPASRWRWSCSRSTCSATGCATGSTRDSRGGCDASRSSRRPRPQDPLLHRRRHHARGRRRVARRLSGRDARHRRRIRLRQERDRAVDHAAAAAAPCAHRRRQRDVREPRSRHARRSRDARACAATGWR